MNHNSSKIYLITSHNRFYGQSRKPWVSIDTNRLHQQLRNGSFEVIELEQHQAVSLLPTIRDSVVLFSFSQIENTRSYLKDLVHILLLNGNLLLPSYELLLCHENKGYQELFKQHLGIADLKGLYLSSREELDSYQIDYPVVLKSVDGSNANGVHLVNSKQELLSKLTQMEAQLSLFDRTDLLRRKYLRAKRSIPGWENYHPVNDEIQYRKHITPRIRFVLQEFIPGLDCDYRVIVLRDKFYVSKRLTRKGDWRASGTKLFTYEEVPDTAILDYAKKLFDKISLPVLAMDLGKSGDSIHLFEFQASHFGITPIQCGPGFFSKNEGNWVFTKAKGCFEDDLARAVIGYLVDKGYDKITGN